MLHIITSNAVPVKNIKEYNDNFVICHLFQKEMNGPFSRMKMKFDFHIFHQDEMEFDQEEYMNSADMEFHFNSEPDITESLKAIIQTIDSYNEKYNGKDGEDEDNPEEFQVIVACNKQWNKQVVKYLRQRFHDKGLDITPLDIYEYFGIVNIDKLKNMIQSALGSEFVYPEDPVSFAYALYMTFAGGLEASL